MSGKRSKEARRLASLRAGWNWGYTDPSGECVHDPPCHPRRDRCVPQPKQAFAHASVAEVLFYGGAVGGGKSEFGLVEAITICIENPNVKVAFFRRKLKELKQEIISRFLLLVPDYIAKFNASDLVATFWNGSQLWFCHAQHEKDVYSYQSAQWVALFIDEASHFTEFQVKYLMTRVRSARLGMRKRIRLMSNPGGVGHGWLKRWFLRPRPEELGPGRLPPQPFEVWRPLPLPGDPSKPEFVPTRQFIPAWFHDNMALANADPHYLAKVYALGGDKAKQLAEGDWDAYDQMIVGPFWREKKMIHETDEDLLALSAALSVGQVIPWHVIPNAHWKPPAGAPIWGSVDYGYGVPWSFHLHAGLPGGHVRTFFEFYMPRKRDVEQAQMIRQLLEHRNYKPEWIVIDPSMKASREELGRAKSIYEVYCDELLHLCNVRLGAAGRPARESRPQRWLDALQTNVDGLPNWTITTACPEAIRTVPDIPWDEEDPDVEDEDSENHCIAEGTLVHTDEGLTPIERILAGDRLLTRRGYRRVLRAWQTSPDAEVFEVVTPGGAVRATGNHGIFDKTRGFIRVDEISNDFIPYYATEVSLWSKLQSCCQRQRRCGGTWSITNAVATLRAVATVAFTAACGETRTGVCRLAVMCTTRMGTVQTTIPTISNSCLESSISRSIVGIRLLASALRVARTLDTLLKRGWQSLVSSRPARCVGDPLTSPVTSCATSIIVPPSASIVRSRNDSESRSRRALSGAMGAALDSPRSDRTSASAVTRSVTTVRPSGRAAVYDLTVEDAHEFFANGLLVHNCYEDIGRFFEARPFQDRTLIVDPYAHLPALERQHYETLDKRHKKRPGGVMGSLVRR
jgi:hypothetical protein